MYVKGRGVGSPSAVAWATHPLRDSHHNCLDRWAGLTSYPTAGAVATGKLQALDHRGHIVESGRPSFASWLCPS